MENTSCKNEELELIIRSKNVVRFKAGADLSGKLNRVVAEVNEDLQDEQQSTEIKIHLTSEFCAMDQQA